jgi:hypothetical protein
MSSISARSMFSACGCSLGSAQSIASSARRQYAYSTTAAWRT